MNIQNKNYKQHRFWQAVFVALLLVWMLVIFVFSHQPGEVSAKISNHALKDIVGTVGEFVPSVELPKTDSALVEAQILIRKSAHFLVYAVLGLLAVSTATSFSMRRPLKYLYAILFCFFYASTDELHQLFVRGRTGSLIDVYLDTIGAGVAILIFAVLEYFICKKTKEKQNNA